MSNSMHDRLYIPRKTGFFVFLVEMILDVFSAD